MSFLAALLTSSRKYLGDLGWDSQTCFDAWEIVLSSFQRHYRVLSIWKENNVFFLLETIKNGEISQLVKDFLC